MLSMRKTLLLCSVFALLCITASGQEVTPSTTPTPASAPAPTTAPAPAIIPVPATVHIYRYKQYTGSFLKPSVYCDGAELGRVQNGSVFDVKIAAGPHTFYSEDKQAGAVLTLEPGKEYFFRTDLQTGVWKGHFRLTIVMPEQGVFDIAKLKPQATK